MTVVRRGAAWLLVAGLAAAGYSWVPLTGPVLPDGPQVVTLDLAATAPAGSAGDWHAAAAEAMEAWNARLQRVRLVEGTRTGPAWYENGRSEMFFDREMFDEPFPSGVLAVCGSTHDRGVLVETDIVFNANLRWGVYHGRISIPYDFRRVAVHELGHLLGLDHPDEAGQGVTAVMNSRVSDVELPTADDDAGVHALYDSGAGVAPVIVTAPKAATVVQGATVSLGVGAGGRGPLAYEWRRDGVTIPAGTDARLRFAAALTDAGFYSVVVRNAAGAVTSPAVRLTVNPAVPPVVDVTFNPAPVPAGSDLTLAGAVRRGDPPLRFEWRKNGAVIPQAETARLVLPDLQFSDSGDYALTVTNAAGSMTTPNLRVVVVPGQPPRFIGELRSVATAPGAFLSLQAPAEVSGPASFQWRKDGVDLPGETGSSLLFTQFRLSDVGRYTVTVTNAFGRVTSNAADVTTFATAPFTIIRQPAAATDYVGAGVSFTVETDLPTTTFRWLKDGVPLTTVPGSRFIGSQTNELRFLNVAPADAGQYAVEVSGAGTVVRSHPAKLTVLAPGVPLIVRQPATHTVAPGEPVSLSVGLRTWETPGPGAGAPAYSYQWYKDGRALPAGTGATLAFNAGAAEAGRYHVRVTSPAGGVESSAAEVVLVPVAGLFRAHPADELFDRETEEFRLRAITAEVVRRRALRENTLYQYTRNGLPIPGTPFDLGDNLPGTYTLTLGTAAAPETSRPFALGFVDLGRPVITRHPRGGAVLVGEPFTLSVAAAPVLGASYRWTRDGVVVPGATRAEWSISYFGGGDAGDYRVTVSNAAGAVTSEIATVAIRGLEAPVIQRQPGSQTVTAGQRVTLDVVTRRGDFRFQWYKDGAPVVGLNAAAVVFPATAAAAGGYAVVVTDGAVTVTSRTAQVTVLAAARPPVILFPPTDTAAVIGGDAAFVVGADGAPLPDRYQWWKDGVALPGATDAKLRLRGVTSGSAGLYHVVVTNDQGSVTSPPARLTVDAAGRLINLATRAAVGRGTDILIAGFVLAGTEPRTVLLRGIGDQLSEFGVGGVLRDPVLSLFDSRGRMLATNDDWFRTGDDNLAALQRAARQAGAFPQREDARDAALLATLTPGSYTAQVSGLANTTGIALVEIYELGPPAKERLINLSSRAVVGTGAGLLIPGLVVAGEAPRRLLLRAVGPGLAGFGVEHALADPVMTVFRGEAAIAANDNWSDQPGAEALAPAMAAVGAFPLAGGSRDAVLLLDLPPGSYTVQVAGAAGATGVALVEVYEVRP